jgi:hypothetical protein
MRTHPNIAHLAQAERHVTLGQGHITRQRELILQLHRDGQDFAEATQLLVQFHELLPTAIVCEKNCRMAVSEVNKF